MVCKVFVLFRIQYFQKCRCRVSLIIGSQLIDFIEKEYRILSAAVFDSAYDPARNSSDISSSVTSDLSFISHAAK